MSEMQVQPGGTYNSRDSLQTITSAGMLTSRQQLLLDIWQVLTLNSSGKVELRQGLGVREASGCRLSVWLHSLRLRWSSSTGTVAVSWSSSPGSMLMLRQRYVHIELRLRQTHYWCHNCSALQRRAMYFSGFSFAIWAPNCACCAAA